MKEYKLLALLFAVLLMTGCDDESGGDNVVTEPVAPSISAPADGSSVTATADNLADEVTITWAAAEFGAQVAISYAVEMDLDGGTFTSPAVLASGLSATTAAIAYGDINTAIISDLGQAANAETAVDVRIVASSAGFDDLVSGVLGMTVTTFEEEIIVEPTFVNIWIAGAFQGWDNTNFISMTSAADNGVYESYIYLPDGQLDFKLYQNQNDWGPDSWGTDNLGDGVMYIANEACCNFVAEAAGHYWLEADVNGLTYKLVTLNWGIIGDATPTGWDADTDMVYNETTQTLEVTLDLISAGSYKFRANDEWAHVFGIDSEGALAYSDHITNGNTEGIDNITVAEDGNYTITLDLHDSNNYTFSAVKN